MPKRSTETPERLLDSALAVFEEDRFDGYTVHAVVARSSISLGSLYHHFGSMDGLSAALYSRCMARLLDAVASEAERARGPRAVVVAIATSYLRFVARRRTEAAFIHTAPGARFIQVHAAEVAAAKQPHLERIVATIRPHVQSGAIARLPETLLEMLLIGPVAETARRWLSDAPGLDLEEAVSVLPERIWRSVRS
jgi:AcrR family transcriptional regulator